MTRPLPRISKEQRRGVEKLLNFVVDKYKHATSVIGKRMWKDDITFLSKLLKQQSYTEEDAKEYNRIRNVYYINKEMDNEQELLGHIL